VSQSAARHIVRETEPLSSEQRQVIDAELTALACELTPGDTRNAAVRKVTATDPEAAEKRAALARARKSVRAVMHGDGTGTLSALLPAEQSLACWQALDHEARCRRADGDERPLNDLMGDLLVERVTGQTKAEDLNLEIAVVISASSLFGVDDQPAKQVGHRGGDYGVLPAGLARQLATSDSALARRLICDPIDGRLITIDTKKRRVRTARCASSSSTATGCRGGRTQARPSTTSTTSPATPTAAPRPLLMARGSASATITSSTFPAGPSARGTPVTR
jgi:hypothetical protein